MLGVIDREIHHAAASEREAARGKGEKPFKRNRAVVSCVAILCTSALGAWCGCFPVKHTVSPGASGVVLDSKTREPIPGAEAVISLSVYPPDSAGEAFTNSRPPVVKTQGGGEFLIPPERGWDIFVVPIDFFAPFGMLVVRHDGYQPVLVPFWSRSVKPLGEVVMTPVQK